MLAGLVFGAETAESESPLGADLYAAVQPGAVAVSHKRELTPPCRCGFPCMRP